MVRSDPNDMGVLTSNSILLLIQNSSVNPITDDSQVKLKERRREAQELADSFWERWRDEYLPLLHERQKWLRPQRNLRVGDLVLMVDENSSRGNWPLAIITEVYPDSKGLVRHAEVHTAKGVYRRNIR